MRTLTQPPPSSPGHEPAVNFHGYDDGRRPARRLGALQAEIDQVCDAIRLSLLEMECFEASPAEQQAIRADLERLVHRLTGLLAVAARWTPKLAAPEIVDPAAKNAAPSPGYLICSNLGHGVCASKARYATVEDALADARDLLDHGLPSVCITDGAGKLVLPDGQVRLRLNPSPGYVFEA